MTRTLDNTSTNDPGRDIMNTHTIAASVTAQPTGKVIVSIAPGHVIDGALITEVRNEGSHIEAVTEYGDVMAFNHGQEIEVHDPERVEGSPVWRGCPTCYSINGGFGPSHKASARCQSGGRSHCTCGTCF